MIDVVVLLKIKERSLFNQYETRAFEIMKTYGCRLLTAFIPRTDVPASEHYDELHCLQFPSLEQLNACRADPELLKLVDLRQNAIEKTEVFVSQSHKSYDAS